MEFTIAKQEFLRGLRFAQTIADRKSTMPMLANVLLRSNGKDLVIGATDLNISVSATLQATIKKEGGITVGAKAIHDIVASAPGDQITFRKTDNNWAEVKAGKVSYKLVGMSDRDFPKVADAKDVPLFPISGTVLRELIDRTLFSVSNDETRFQYNGSLFESDGNIARMVSTDGHRLSKVERAAQGGPVLAAGVIIPKKGLIEIKKIADTDGTLQLGIKAPFLYLVAESYILSIKLIDANFVKYESLIPKTHQRTATVVRTDLIDALKRAQLMSSENRAVKFEFGTDALTITSDNPDMGEVKEEVDMVFEGQPMTIGFNPKYYIDILSQITSEKIKILMTKEEREALVTPMSDESYTCLVMPMKI